MDRPVREKKRPNHYDPAKEAAKPQWKKRKSEKKPVHTYFVSDEEEPEPPIAGSSSGAQEPPAHNGPVHTYFTDSD